MTKFQYQFRKNTELDQKINMEDIHTDNVAITVILLSLKEGKQDKKRGLQFNFAIHETKKYGR
jgi:hypothetical protein